MWMWRSGDSEGRTDYFSIFLFRDRNTKAINGEWFTWRTMHAYSGFSSASPPEPRLIPWGRPCQDAQVSCDCTEEKRERKIQSVNDKDTQNYEKYIAIPEADRARAVDSAVFAISVKCTRSNNPELLGKGRRAYPSLSLHFLHSTNSIIRPTNTWHFHRFFGGWNSPDRPAWKVSSIQLWIVHIHSPLLERKSPIISPPCHYRIN